MSELKITRQAIDSLIARFLQEFWKREDFFFQLYVFFLLGGFLAYQLLSPIRIGDTDMWYHLNGGRFFWQTGQVPNTSFFSFITPEREWTNYYWGFQAIIYKVFELGGYQGLVILRSIVVFAIALLIYLFLFNKRQPISRPVALILLGLILILLDSRTYQLRPHLFSYFFIISFLYVLEFKPKLAPVLPVATILWGNLHGIEWPAGALICGIYALNPLHKVLTRQPFEADRGSIYLLSLLLCAPAFLINPYGIDLFLAPFNVPPDVYLYTHELKELSIESFYKIYVDGLNITSQNVLTLLLLLIPITLLIGIYRGLVSIEAILLVIGGYILLSKGVRFIWEWLLLGLPILTLAVRQGILAGPVKKDAPAFKILLIFLLLTAPIYKWYSTDIPPENYPFNSTGLPTGISDFIHHVDGKGKILAPPSKAGYTEWSLYPKLKTFIDMEYPPFNAEDFFELKSAYKTQQGLKRFLEKHQPEWIAIPLKHVVSKNLKEHPDYIPVFADDVQALYANRELVPGISDKYHLKYVNLNNLEKKLDGSVEDHINDLKRIHQVTPNLKRVNLALARVMFTENRYEEALFYAKALQTNYPKDANSHYLAGISNQNLKRFPEALDAYEKTLEVAGKKFRKTVYRQMGVTHYLMSDFSKAYELLKKGINPYTDNPEIKDLYTYAFCAVSTGRNEEAAKLFRMILLTAPENEETVIKNSTELLAKIESGELQTPSFLDWLKSLY